MMETQNMETQNMEDRIGERRIVESQIVESQIRERQIQESQIQEDRIYRKQDGGHIKLAAHRGFTPEGPENSLAAFEAAGRHGFWAIETDVRRSLDGWLVCCHNEAVDEMYDGNGRIEDLTWKELSALHFRQKKTERMPLFEEYLQICKQYGAIPFIETKTMDIKEVLEMALRYFDEKDLILSSVHMEHLLAARKLSPDVFLHHIFSTPEQMEDLSRLGRCGVSYNYKELDTVPEGLIERTHEKGVLVCLRAGDSPEAVEKMLEMNLDYIPTNRMTKEMVMR